MHTCQAINLWYMCTNKYCFITGIIKVRQLKSFPQDGDAVITFEMLTAYCTPWLMGICMRCEINAVDIVKHVRGYIAASRCRSGRWHVPSMLSYELLMWCKLCIWYWHLVQLALHISIFAQLLERVLRNFGNK